MARTPALSAEEAEAACCEAYGGPRTHTNATRITSENRGPVRAWLTARGVASDYARAMTLSELRAAWCDTTNENLRWHQYASNRTTTTTTTTEPPTMNALDLRPGTRRPAPTIEHEPTPTPAPSAMAPDVASAATALAAALAAMQPKAAPVDADTVRAIVAQEIAKAHKPLTIEIRTDGAEPRRIEGIAHPMLPKLLAACQAVRGRGGMGVWIAGPTGSGKTHAAKQVAEAFTLAFLHNGALADPYALLGYQDAGGTYHGTAFRTAYEHGGIYCFDEVDASDNAALLALNGALANGACTFPDGAVKMHPDFICIATANTWGMGATAEFVGRSRIDAAFMSRFPIRLGWTYDENTERALAGNDAWTDRVQRARRRAQEAGLKVIIDPRTTYAGAALIASGMTPDDAAGITYLANLAPAQRQQIEG
jgi:cobaltochelatase CobS